MAAGFSMIDLITITNDVNLAAKCDALPGMRLFVDLERNGKAERQAGRNTFISTHQIADIARVRAVLKHSRLMVRVNPCEIDKLESTHQEIEDVLARGADLLMLPMFTCAEPLQAFAALVAGRVPVVPLLETAGALASLNEWIDTPGIEEVFVGLNDLHTSLGCRFMFEPLALGHVDRVARATVLRELRFGFGGVARAHEGLLPGRDVLAEHVRLGSQAVILSRTFNHHNSEIPFEQAVAELRQAEQQLNLRTPEQTESDRLRVAALIRHLAEQNGSKA